MARINITRSGPKIPAAGHLEGVIFWDLWLNLTHFGSLWKENSGFFQANLPQVKRSLPRAKVMNCEVVRRPLRNQGSWVWMRRAAVWRIAGLHRHFTLLVSPSSSQYLSTELEERRRPQTVRKTVLILIQPWGEILYGADDLRARRFCAAVVD